MRWGHLKDTPAPQAGWSAIRKQGCDFTTTCHHPQLHSVELLARQTAPLAYLSPPPQPHPHMIYKKVIMFQALQPCLLSNVVIWSSRKQRQKDDWGAGWARGFVRYDGEAVRKEPWTSSFQKESVKSDMLRPTTNLQLCLYLLLFFFIFFLNLFWSDFYIN